MRDRISDLVWVLGGARRLLLVAAVSVAVAAVAAGAIVLRPGSGGSDRDRAASPFVTTIPPPPPKQACTAAQLDQAAAVSRADRDVLAHTGDRRDLVIARIAAQLGVLERVCGPATVAAWLDRLPGRATGAAVRAAAGR